MAIAYPVKEGEKLKVPTLCINPNCSVVYNQYIGGERSKKVLATHDINFVDNFHDLQMSGSAVKNIRKAVQIIAYLNKKKKIDAIKRNSLNRGLNKKWAKMRKTTIKNFCLVTFATFTLPSKQKHTDTEITHECINPLLQYLRKYYNLKYFVWKKELQENGNLHFHMVLDCFVDYYQLRTAWNRLINKGKVRGIAEPFNYVDEYRKNRLQEYKNGFVYMPGQKLRDMIDFEIDRAQRKNGGEILSTEQMDKISEQCRNVDEDCQRRAYNAQMKLDPDKRWTDPNSTDIKAVKKAQQVASYIAKYLAKDMYYNSPEIQQYINETNEYKQLIWQTLKNITAEANKNDEIKNYCLQWKNDHAADRSHLSAQVQKLFEDLENLLEGLKIYREKNCPVLGRLWMKSQTLTVFAKGCHLELDDYILEELKILERELHVTEHNKDYNPNGLQLVYRDEEKSLITFICTVFQFARYKRWYLLNLYDDWIDECLAFNKTKKL